MHRKWDSEPLQDLRQLGDVSERVGNVSNLLNVPKLTSQTVAEKQVSYQRFAADQKLVRQHVPGSNPQAAFPNELVQDFPLLGTNLKIVLEYDSLRVQVEMSVGWIALQKVEQGIHDMHQAYPKLLESGVPFPVPMRVRDDKDCGFLFSSKN